MNPTIQSTIQVVISCEELVSLAEQNLAEAKRALEAAEQQTLDAFADDPQQGAIIYAGRKWSAETKTTLSPDTGCSDLVVGWIMENGGADLCKPAMHHARRDSFLRERFLDDDGNVNLPEDLIELVRVFDLPKLARRKA